MKNLLSTILSLIVGAGVGSAFTYYLLPRPITTESTPINKITTSKTGTDDYEIRWYGKPKNQYWGGNYTILKPSSPMEIIKIPKSPHVVKIKLPKQSTVGAGGNTQDIKIFRNGKECGKAGIIGEGIPLNKACSPEL